MLTPRCKKIHITNNDIRSDYKCQHVTPAEPILVIITTALHVFLQHFSSVPCLSVTPVLQSIVQNGKQFKESCDTGFAVLMHSHSVIKHLTNLNVGQLEAIVHCAAPLLSAGLHTVLGFGAKNMIETSLRMYIKTTKYQIFQKAAIVAMRIKQVDNLTALRKCMCVFLVTSLEVS